MSVAVQIKNLLLNSDFSNVFSTIPSALDCAEPIVVSAGELKRKSRLHEEERGSVPVDVLAVREVELDAEAIAVACEKAVRRADWEPYADSSKYRIVSLDTTAPAFRERDSSGRFVWDFKVDCTAVRSL